MKPYLTNPFTEAYVTHTVSDEHFVHSLAQFSWRRRVRFFNPAMS